LIIIDEAHNYRNEFIQDYGMLHELCQGNKVMLLTATPFNNQPSDIYSMLKLFQIPTKSG
jgi:superfamily II DNA or RNA helicase